jgi:hypothetical protein
VAVAVVFLSLVQTLLVAPVLFLLSFQIHIVLFSLVVLPLP